MDTSVHAQASELLCFWKDLIENEEDFYTKMRTLRGRQTLQDELWRLYQHQGLSSTFGKVLTLINKQPDDLRHKLIELYRSVPLPREVENSGPATPAVIVLGLTQSGKTTLVNSIRKYSGFDGPDLLVGDGNGSTTTKTTLISLAAFDIPSYIELPGSLEEFLTEDWKRPLQTWRKSIPGFRLVDACGLGDSEGKDPRHILDLARVIRDAGSLSGVILVIDSNSHFGSLIEGLDYYLRFLSSLNLPLFVVHTKWDPLEKTIEEKEHRENAVQQLIWEIAKKKVGCIHFFIDLCGWENNFLKQTFTEHYEALKSNSLHALCKHITARTSYSTHEFMIEKPKLFKTVDSELMEILRNYLRQMEHILSHFKTETRVISQIYTCDVDLSFAIEEHNRLYKETLSLDTGDIIDFHTFEPNLKQDEIFCTAATSYKLVDIPSQLELKKITITNEGVKAKIVWIDPNGPDKWDSVYFKDALIATGPSSSLYKPRIGELKEEMKGLSRKIEDLKVAHERHASTLPALDLDTENILNRSKRLGWLYSFLSRPKLSIPEYAAFLSYYEEYEAKREFKNDHPAEFADSIFARIQYSSPLPSAVVTPENPIAEEGVVLSASQLCETFDEVTVRGRFFGGPVTVCLAAIETEVVGENRNLQWIIAGEKTLGPLTSTHWCLLLKSERDLNNIYIIELGASEESQIVPCLGRLNDKGKEVYKNAVLQIVGTFPGDISLEFIYFLVTVKHPFGKDIVGSKAPADNYQSWAREIIPLLKEAGMKTVYGREGKNLKRELIEDLQTWLVQNPTAPQAKREFVVSLLEASTSAKSLNTFIHELWYAAPTTERLEIRVPNARKLLERQGITIPPRPTRSNSEAPIESKQSFYLKIGSRHYLNLDEKGMAYWSERNEDTPFFRKVQKNGEVSFFLQIMSPAFKNRFLTAGLLDKRLVVTSEDEAPSFVFFRERGTDSFRTDDRLYCSYFWGDRSPICLRNGTHYLYSTDFNGGIDVAVMEVPVAL